MEILDVPAGVDFASVELIMRDSVSRAASPYTGAQARVDFGGRWWEMTLTTTPLILAVASDLDGWADSLAEPGVAARILRPVLVGVHGTASASSVTVATAAAANASAVAVAGVGAGLTIARGSLLSIGGRLHRVRRELVGGSGEALRIVPPLRAAVLVGDVVQWGAAAAGLWLLSERPPRRHEATAGAWSDPVTLKFSEAVT
jgi:hypothetical protein